MFINLAVMALVVFPVVAARKTSKHVISAITSEFTVAPTFFKQLKNRHKIYAGPRNT